MKTKKKSDLVRETFWLRPKHKTIIRKQKMGRSEFVRFAIESIDNPKNFI